MELIRSWRHSGFDVFVGRPIASNDRRALEHVARYLLRAPVSLERMRYDPQNARVTIRPMPGEQGGAIELEALEFISRLITRGGIMSRTGHTAGLKQRGIRAVRRAWDGSRGLGPGNPAGARRDSNFLSPTQPGYAYLPEQSGHGALCFMGCSA